MLGIILAVISSNWLGEWIHSDGVYETDLEADGSIIFLKPSPPRKLLSQSVEQIMTPQVWSFAEVESVDFITAVLRRTTHNGFPVLGEQEAFKLTEGGATGSGALGKDVGSSRQGSFQGLILRSQLLVLLAEQAFCDQEGRPLRPVQDELRLQLELDRKMRVFYRYHFMHQRHMITSLSLTEALLTLHDTGQEEHSNPQCSYDRQPDRLQQAAHSVSSSSTHDGLEGRDDQGLPLNGIDAAEQAMQCPCLYLDLRSYMDIAPPSVQLEAPGERAHSMFTTMGLRHLVVTDDRHWVQGMVTRRDLDHAAGPGAWRRNRVAPRLAALPAQLRLRHVASAARLGLAKLTTLGATLTTALSSPRIAELERPDEQN